MKQELIIALVGGIGVDFDNVSSILEREFKSLNCDVKQIIISKLADKIDSHEIDTKCETKRIESYMEKCSKLRKKYTNNFMAMLSIMEICKLRKETKKPITVYILNSVKRHEEYKLLRRMYGRNFILLSINTSMEKREKNIYGKSFSKGVEEDKQAVVALIKRDQKETEKKHKKCGQNVSDTFPAGHFFVDSENNLDNDIRRFIDILFGYPFHTPTIDERNMFIATSMMFRSADLSRQVGVVIADDEGDIIATGCNEVPKFGGGFYEPEDKNDARDYMTKGKKDPNTQKKVELIKDSLKKLKNYKPSVFTKKIDSFLDNLESEYSSLEKEGMQLTDLLEFGRPVHAEMAAICDAARRGVPLKDKILYCTTYPCHICAKHILNVGIKKVVYIEPYPKSKATDLFDEAISTNSDEKNKLVFEPFVGIAPRRYMFLFKLRSRKDENKITIKQASRTGKITYLHQRDHLDYLLRELSVLKLLRELLNNSKASQVRKLKNDISKLYNETIKAPKNKLLREAIDSYAKNLNDKDN